jgi:hypothetical protein
MEQQYNVEMPIFDGMSAGTINTAAQQPIFHPQQFSNIHNYLSKRRHRDDNDDDSDSDSDVDDNDKRKGRFALGLAKNVLLNKFVHYYGIAILLLLAVILYIVWMIRRELSELYNE